MATDNNGNGVQDHHRIVQKENSGAYAQLNSDDLNPRESYQKLQLQYDDASSGNVQFPETDGDYLHPQPDPDPGHKNRDSGSDYLYPQPEPCLVLENDLSQTGYVESQEALAHGVVREQAGCDVGTDPQIHTQSDYLSPMPDTEHSSDQYLTAQPELSPKNKLKGNPTPLPQRNNKIHQKPDPLVLPVAVTPTQSDPSSPVYYEPTTVPAPRPLRVERHREPEPLPVIYDELQQTPSTPPPVYEDLNGGRHDSPQTHGGHPPENRPMGVQPCQIFIQHQQTPGGLMVTGQAQLPNGQIIPQAIHFMQMTQPQAQPIDATPKTSPPHYMCLAVIACFFFYPIALIALVYSCMSRKSADGGFYSIAQSQGRTTRNMAIAAIVIGIVILLSWTIPLGISNSQQRYSGYTTAAPRF